MTYHIRPMVAQDKPAIMKILKATTEFNELDTKVAEEVLDAYLGYADSGYFILVAEEEKSLLGYICYGPTPLTNGTWDVYWMAVTPQRRDKGIGGSLLLLAEQEIRRNKGRLVIIETSSRPDYELTRRFYQKQNYIQTCQIPDFYAVGDGLTIFTKYL